jgi:hypothetical protein
MHYIYIYMRTAMHTHPKRSLCSRWLHQNAPSYDQAISGESAHAAHSPRRVLPCELSQQPSAIFIPATCFLATRAAVTHNTECCIYKTTVRTAAFWNVTTWSKKQIQQHFAENYCHHLRGRTRKDGCRWKICVTLYVLDYRWRHCSWKLQRGAKKIFQRNSPPPSSQ